MLSFDDFKKMKLVVAQIKEVNDHPNADRLYVMKVDTGEEQRQLVAGIRTAYPKEDLIGRQIVMISNLEPAVIRGEESQGMLLAVGDADGIVLLKPDREVPLGSVVR